MLTTSGDGDDVAQACWYSALAVVVVAPGNDGAISFEHDIVERPRGDRDHVGQVCRRCATTSIAPTDHGAIAPKRQTVDGTRRDCHHSGQSCWGCALPVTTVWEAIQTPGQHRAVILQRQTVITLARGNG